MVIPTLIACLAVAPKWAIGNNLQLTWGGDNYVPVGIQVEGNSKDIPAAISAGIKDFNLEISSGSNWKEVAEKMGASRYFFTVTSSLPYAQGTIVQPQFYRLNNIRKSDTISCALPGATKALIIVALARDGSIISSKTADVKNGVLRTDIKAALDSEQVALIYPFGESMMMEDLWERLDERRDQVLRQVRILGAQNGLRGIINPLGSTPYLANRDTGFVPSSPLFRAEFATFLEEKYRNIQTLAGAWNVQGLDLDPKSFNFDRAAQLVPLWNGSLGVSAVYQPWNNMVMPANSKRSTYWHDLAEEIGKTRDRRVHRILRSIRRAASVPVMQDWAGWSWFFENPENELTGLTIRLNKFTPSGLLASLSGAMSSNLRSRNPGPIFAIDVPYSPDLDQAAVLDDLNSYGIRGLFVRPRNADDYAKIAKMSLGEMQSRPNAIYFPVNASNPAFAQKLGNNLLWLPSPADGNRLDLGRDLSGYQISDGANISYVIWANQGRITQDFLMANPAAATIRSLAGIPPVVTITKTGLRIELDHNPIIIQGATNCPVPVAEMLRVERETQNLFASAISNHRDVTLEQVDFRRYKETVDASPDKALMTLKKVHRSLTSMLTGVVWAEFESATDSLFSEVVQDAGCSGNAYLNVRTPLAEATGLVYATINVPQRTTAPLDVWVAARIPNPDDRARLKLKIGGQIMSFSNPPVDGYGSGFAWYSLGSTKLPSFKTPVRAELVGTTSTDVSIDCIVLSPIPFRPTNIQMPEISVGPIKSDKPDKKG